MKTASIFTAFLISVSICFSLESSYPSNDSLQNQIAILQSRIAANENRIETERQIIEETKEFFSSTLSTLDWIMGICGAIIAVVIGALETVGFLEGRKMRERIDKEKDELKNEISILKTEYSTYKKEYINISEIQKTYKPLLDELVLSAAKYKAIDERINKIINTTKEKVEQSNQKLGKILKKLDEKRSIKSSEKCVLEDFYLNSEILREFGCEFTSSDYRYRGIFYLLNSEFSKAIYEFSKGLELEPSSYQTMNSMGCAYSRLYSSTKNDTYLNKAFEYYDKSLEIAPSYYKALDNKACLLAKTKNYNKAIEYHKKAIESKPDFTNIWYNTACTYALLGNKPELLNYLAEAINRDDYYISIAQTDEDFSKFRDDPDFIKLINKN